MKDLFIIRVVICTALSFGYPEAQVSQVCNCPQNYDPVCATDGNTYPNSCELECKQLFFPALTQVKRGPCGKPDRPFGGNEPCICTANYQPVCGDNDKTYGNECELGCAQGVQLAYNGPCKDQYSSG